RLLGPRHPLVARSLHNLGWVEELRGHPVEARKNLGLSLEIREEIFGKEHPESLKTAMLLNQARLLDREPTLGEAMRVFEGRRSRLGAEHPDTAHALAILGIAQVQEGFLSAADVTLTTAIQLEAQVLGPTQAERAFPYLGLGLLREQQGRFAEAQAAYQQAVDQWNGLLLDNHPWLAWAGVGLHRCARRAGSPPPAFSPESLLRRLAPDHPLRREWEQIQHDTPVP
ncbi:MAG TPA: tetratricopeptide repeat protein, partial [Myxococcota bacterium]|nr:tetratricopeptide repeat protein [Myxococcota bacterium]